MSSIHDSKLITDGKSNFDAKGFLLPSNNSDIARVLV